MESKTINLSNLTFKALSNHLYSEIAEEAVILNLESGVYYGLNEVGVDIWKWLQQPQTTQNLLNLLLQEYDVTPEQAKKDLEAILQEMLAAKLIEVVNSKVA